MVSLLVNDDLETDDASLVRSLEPFSPMPRDDPEVDVEEDVEEEATNEDDAEGAVTEAGTCGPDAAMFSV